MVSTTLSEEMTKAKIPKGNGSKGSTRGISLRLIALQVSTRRTCNSKNAVLPIILVIASLARSVGVRRSSASCSSLAIASIFGLVGFAGSWPIGFIIIIPSWLRRVRLNPTTKHARCTDNRITRFQQSSCFLIVFGFVSVLTEVSIYWQFNRRGLGRLALRQNSEAVQRPDNLTHRNPHIQPANPCNETSPRYMRLIKRRSNRVGAL
jgi:hypothetical protein